METRHVKLALRRENDGTPIGHPAPCFFLCPCGAKIPVYDRKGQRVNGYGKQPLKCTGCQISVDMDGWIQDAQETLAKIIAEDLDFGEPLEAGIPGH